MYEKECISVHGSAWSYNHHAWSVVIPASMRIAVNYLQNNCKLAITACENRDGATTTLSAAIETDDEYFSVTATVKNTRDSIREAMVDLLKELYQEATKEITDAR